MRILILTPTAFPFVTGNASTTERWRRSLVKQGHRVRVLATEGLDVPVFRQVLADFEPDLVHVHHAFRAGQLLFNPSIESASNGRPLVVSPGGTDINLDSQKDDRRKIITRVLERAKAVVVQSEEMRRRINGCFPGLQDRVVRIPKSISWMGGEAFDLRGAAGCGRENVLFFFPAGIRPVKGNLEALLLLEKAHAERSVIRAVFAGPALDEAYAVRFDREAKRLRAFARWIPPIPVQAMRSAYEGADVVLNASSSEGLSNVLLEAQAAGKPILASDIPENRQPVLGENGDSPAGLLFNLSDSGDFLRQALRLVDDPELRHTLGQGGKNQAARLPGSEEEGLRLLRVYETALNT